MKKLLALIVAVGCCSPILAQEKKGGTPEERFKAMDKNSDGKIDLAEYKGKAEGDKATKAEERFKKLDKNSDGGLDLEEFKAGGKKKAK
jgi:Ca2+-binding EF-hand superfamily protein